MSPAAAGSGALGSTEDPPAAALLDVLLDEGVPPAAVVPPEQPASTAAPSAREPTTIARRGVARGARARGGVLIVVTSWGAGTGRPR